MAGRREAMESATENTPPMAGLRRPQGRQSHFKKSSLRKQTARIEGKRIR